MKKIIFTIFLICLFFINTNNVLASEYDDYKLGGNFYGLWTYGAFFIKISSSTPHLYASTTYEFYCHDNNLCTGNNTTYLKKASDNTTIATFNVGQPGSNWFYTFDKSQTGSYYFSTNGSVSQSNNFLIEGNPISGCTNPIAYNYNVDANTDDGSCVLPLNPIIPLTTTDILLSYAYGMLFSVIIVIIIKTFAHFIQF